MLAGGDVNGARGQVEKALALAKQSDDRGLKLDVSVAEARLDTRSGKSADAVRLLERTLKDAQSAGLLQSAFEARLAAGEAQIANGQKGKGVSTLQALARDAKARGYELIARRATASAKG